MDIMDYLDEAKNIFTKAKYEATDEEIRMLAANMVTLKARGLGKLNEKLVSYNKPEQIWDFIAEHNFAVILVSQFDPEIPIIYEPPGCPIDFKVEMGSNTYWVQVKNSSILEIENRRKTMLREIKRKVKDVKIKKFFNCKFSANFEKSCLQKLIDFIKYNAPSAPEGKCFDFKCDGETAIIEFWPGNGISELTYGGSSDLEAVEITGKNRDQIKGGLLKGMGAFEWNTDQRNINLIVMEADNKDDIDICDAVLGTAYETNHSWSRDHDGLFREPEFSKKVSSVIAMKRKKHFDYNLSEPDIVEIAGRFGMDPAKYRKKLNATGYLKPISDYHMILYLNESHRPLLEDINRLLLFDEVIYRDMRPPNGEGNFDSMF